MPNPDRQKLQGLYPEPKKRSGMDARKPTKFSVPILKLSLLLFFPIYLTIAIYSIQIYGGHYEYSTFALSFIAIFAFVILIIIASLVMLIYAHSIIVRNCVRSWVVEGIYLVLIVPFGFIMLFSAGTWFDGISLYKLLIIEAAILYSLVLINTIIARQLNR